MVTIAVGLTAVYGVAEGGWTEPVAATEAAIASDAIAETEMPVALTPPNRPPEADILDFQPPTVSRDRPQPIPAAPRVATAAARSELFAGGSDSLVARVVGAAEGTRTPDGGKTSLYEGHVDPGNGVWNRGTFSYQFGNHENLSAEEADRRQMAKIQHIYESVLLPKAEQYGVAPLTLAEELNGIDLINQAPLTVTEAGGYIERLAEAKQKGLSGEAAILEARIWSFWDPGRNGWDAPGLRAYDDLGKEVSIRHDQQRRMGMIDAALTAYEQQHGAIAARPVPAPPDSSPVPPAISAQRADAILSGQLPAAETMPIAIGG